MRIAVIGKTFQRSKQYFNKIIGEIDPSQIVRQIKSNNYHLAELKNGDIYRIISPLESSRGYKIDKAYVEYGVAADFIDIILYPMLSHSPLLLEEQIVYWR